MGVYASQSFQTTGSHAIFTGIRDDNPMMVSHNDIDYLSLTVYKKAYLSANFMGERAYVTSKFECDKELRWEATAI
jgi:hypothetical protein